MEERHFTVEEANRMLPLLRPILRDLKREWMFLQYVNDDIRRAHEASDQGGGSALGPVYIEAAERVVHHAHSIQEMGVLLKDPATGLCDFPHQRNSRIVYLCWKLGEDTIGWWHDADAGFAGREPLENLDE